MGERAGVGCCAKIKPCVCRAGQTIMPINSNSKPATNLQADADALAHGLTRWAHYPVTAQRVQELSAEFTQLNASVQTGAQHLQFDDEPSAFTVWLNGEDTRV
jgi:hypothetical protein